MWQKARQVAAHPNGEDAHLIGKTFYVQGAPIKARDGIRTFLTNILAWDGSGDRLTIDTDSAELLGGPDAFAETVPLIPWEEYIKP